MKRVAAYIPVTQEMMDDCQPGVLEYIQGETATAFRRWLYPWEFPDKPVAWNVGPLLPHPLEWLAARIDRAA